MPRGKKELAEQIIPKLREVEVEVRRGKTVLEAVKKIGVTEQTYYRWKKKFGGLRFDQAKRLKDLEHRLANGLAAWFVRDRPSVEFRTWDSPCRENVSEPHGNPAARNFPGI